MSDERAEDLYREPREEKEDPKPPREPAPRRATKRETKKKQDEEALRHEVDWTNVLASPSGRRLTAYVLHELCKYRESPFHPSNSVMCNIAGRRQVGIQIEREIRDISFELWSAVDRELEELRVKPSKASSS